MENQLFGRLDENFLENIFCIRPAFPRKKKTINDLIPIIYEYIENRDFYEFPRAAIFFEKINEKGEMAVRLLLSLWKLVENLLFVHR